MAEPSYAPLDVRRVIGERDLAAAFAVRWRVFVEEQHVPPAVERDEWDASAAHVIVESNGTVVATGRLVAHDGTGHIGRIAVLPEWRRRGIAGRVIVALEAEAARRGLREISLHSQFYIQGLYDQHGYRVSGPVFLEAGIDHVPMTKRL